MVKVLEKRKKIIDRHGWKATWRCRRWDGDVGARLGDGAGSSSRLLIIADETTPFVLPRREKGRGGDSVGIYRTGTA